MLLKFVKHTIEYVTDFVLVAFYTKEVNIFPATILSCVKIETNKKWQPVTAYKQD